MNAGNITLLKLADKLVREGHYAQALGAILKARQEDPANRYAEAYEERVRALMTPQQTGTEPVATQCVADNVETSLSASIEEIVPLLGKANEALSCNNFPGALELIGQARTLDPDDVDIKALEEHVRATCSNSPIDMTPGHEQEIIRGTIRAFEDEVYELAALGEYEDAKELLERALMLDPADNDLRACERFIHAAAKVDRQHTEAYMLAANTVHWVEPDPSPESESETATDAAPPERPDPTGNPAGEPAPTQHVEPAVARASHTATRRAEIHQHLNAARVLCDGGAHDEALTEIALGYIIDPMHEGLHALEESVWTAKTSCTAADESPRSSGDCSRLIRLQILAAEEFARSGEFRRALDGLAKAYVIDPSNNELKRAEVRIRQQEIRHHQAAAQPLTLVYHHERVANAE